MQFLPDILIINESYNLTAGEVQLANPTKRGSHKCYFCNFHAINLRYSLIPSRDTDEQRILQSYCKTGKTGHSQPQKVVLDVTFL